jgi:putative tricarboxylic transport membrane protein
MEIKTIDRLFAAALVVLGLYIVTAAIGYGYMRDAAPGPGFFPFWAGAALAGLSLLNLARSFRGHEVLTTRFNSECVLKTAGIVMAIAVYILVTPLVGMAVAVGLLILATAYIIRPRWTFAFTWKIAVVAVVFPIVGHVLFGVYLRVPLVRGILGF